MWAWIKPLGTKNHLSANDNEKWLRTTPLAWG